MQSLYKIQELEETEEHYRAKIVPMKEDKGVVQKKLSKKGDQGQEKE